MSYKLYISALTILLSFIGFSQQVGQENSSEIEHSIGFIVGRASQKTFPQTSNDYVYNTTSIKLQYERKLWDWGKWDAHILIEPSYYRVNHQLLNFFFIEPSEPDFQERRDRFTTPRTFDEWALNIGLKVDYPILKNLDSYAMLSSGPMTQGDDTERLKRGFSFSNVLGFGIQYQFSPRIKWDARLMIRHTSNAGLRFPNSGHNSLGGETGFIFVLE